MTERTNERRLTERQVDKACARRSYTPKVIEIAKRLLVEGAAPSTVAAESGLTLSRIFQIQRSVFEAHLSLAGIPRNWITLQICGPAVEVRAFAKRMERLRLDLAIVEASQPGAKVAKKKTSSRGGAARKATVKVPKPTRSG